MDEFTSKDPTVRTAVVRAALEHFGILGEQDGEAELRPALDVFSVHSQAGSKMSGPKAKLVSDSDVQVTRLQLELRL